MEICMYITLEDSDRCGRVDFMREIKKGFRGFLSVDTYLYAQECVPHERAGNPAKNIELWLTPNNAKALMWFLVREYMPGVSHCRHWYRHIRFLYLSRKTSGDWLLKRLFRGAPTP